MTSVLLAVGVLFAVGSPLPWLLWRPAWENRDNPGATGLLIIIPSVSLYVLASAVHTVTTTPAVWYLASNLLLLAILSVGIGWFLTATEYTGYVTSPRSVLGVLGVVLLLHQSALWTNPLHHQFYDPIETLTLPASIAPNAQILFVIHTVGTYLLVFAGVMACLNDAFNSRGIRRRQNLALLGSVVPPIVTNIIWLAGWTPQNLAPLSFVLSVFVLGWALFEADFLDVAPVGRDQAIRSMDDPMIILDEDGKVVESNRAARDLAGVDGEWRGLAATEFFSQFAAQFDKLTEGVRPDGEISVEEEGRRRYFDPNVSAIEGGDGDGRLILLREITQLKERERRLQQLHRESEQILDGRDRESVCEAAIDAVEELMSVPHACAHLYHRREEALVAVAATDGFGDIFDVDDPICDGPESAIWDVYESGEMRQISDAELDTVFRGDQTPVEGVLILSLGAHGALVLSATEADGFEETDRYFGQLLSTTIATALDRARREQGLETVQAVTRDAMTATTRQEMAETVLERVPEALDFPISAIWEYEPQEDELQPVASTSAAEPMFAEVPVFEPGNSIAWRAFESGETKLIRQTSNYPEAYNPDGPIASEVISPIGDYGIMAAGSAYESNFTEGERQIIETFTTNLETASRLLERRRDLRLLDQVLGRLLRHNLRNKLVVMQARAGQIRETVDGETAELAESIVESCSKLDELSSHAQVMRDIVEKRGETDQIPLRQAAERSVTQVRRDYPDAEITTQFDSTPTVDAHPNLVAAVSQLVRNGVEHGPDSGTVGVRVFDAPGGPAVEITDSGPGIPNHELEILKKHGESALEHGSGVGLWVVDRVVEYSNASLEFTVDDGTVARIWFPE